MLSAYGRSGRGTSARAAAIPRPAGPAADEQPGPGKPVGTHRGSGEGPIGGFPRIWITGWRMDIGEVPIAASRHEQKHIFTNSKHSFFLF